MPVSQSDMMVAALRKNGTPLWYVVYTDAGHLQFTTSTNNYNMYAWILFVQRYLLN